MKRIEVAVGIVYNQAGHVLVGQRVVEDMYFNKWEFPGGKLEQGESSEFALVREFREEVGIHIIRSRPLMLLEHDYPDRQVRLHVRIVEDYQGEVQSLEGQAIKWVAPMDLQELDFLQGNQAILEALISREINEQA
ncbi:MAG: 8-oxo-dGTP diphosphatase [Cryomorphaceae bacterium]|jgi:8-oxo-dGTP diphosphatase